jgi:peptide/nickel transport system substrate-binding protein
MRILLSSILAVALGAAACGASAATFKWASAADIPTWDIHSQNNALGNGVHAAVYESLFTHNRKFELESVLATGYRQSSSTQVRITPRQGVKFHDGAAFNDDDTIDVFTKGPNPVLLRQMTELRMMDKEWAEKNKSVEPKDIKTEDENFALRNANDTGPFMLKNWEQDVKLVLVKNPAWWGKAEGNVTEIVYTPIKAEATRVAALLSGEADLVLDPSPADLPKPRAVPELKVIEGAENRTIFFGMDQYRDELPGSNVKGKNPLKDVRVRRALYQAIDIQTIARVTTRGLSQPTGALISPARTTPTSTTRRSARRWRRCGPSAASRPGCARCPCRPTCR